MRRHAQLNEIEETLSMPPTVIAGHRCADDFAVIWRGVSIDRT
jgi:hypothetical protein